MRAFTTKEDEPVAELNLIPLIDIALTLLIIMMITTTFIRQPGFALKLPEASTRQGEPEAPKDITIGINSAGEYYIDGRQQSERERIAALKTAYDLNHEVRVLVKGDKNVPYGRVSSVMDLISQANIKHINLPTDPKPGQSATTP